MIITSPVKFDGCEDTFAPDGNRYNWVKVNGYDANNFRITNIVGHDGVDYLKICSREGCGTILHAAAYGEEGRYTDRLRDQSNCPEHRGGY